MQFDAVASGIWPHAAIRWPDSQGGKIARLAATGVVEVAGSLQDWITDRLRSLRCGTIEISHEIALGAYSLPGDFHRDPADRLLVSTAGPARVVLITADERILGYPHVKSLNARQ